MFKEEVKREGSLQVWEPKTWETLKLKAKIKKRPSLDLEESHCGWACKSSTIHSISSCSKYCSHLPLVLSSRSLSASIFPLPFMLPSLPILCSEHTVVMFLGVHYYFTMGLTLLSYHPAVKLSAVSPIQYSRNTILFFWANICLVIALYILRGLWAILIHHHDLKSEFEWNRAQLEL